MTHQPSTQPNSSVLRDGRRFFSDLPLCDSFDQAIEKVHERTLPDDWWVVITDIVNSTEAIRRGRYKDVNAIGASVIIAAINLDRSIQIPYVFGGDGANLAIPPDLEIPMRKALLATQALSKSAFGLDLRITMIPVHALASRGAKLCVARYKQSPHMELALFAGDGWSLAEKWTKDGEKGAIYAVINSPDVPPEASYDGFECRWQSVPPERDHKLCILIACAENALQNERETFKRVLTKLHDIYGDFKNHHPVSISSLSLSLNPFRLITEAKIRATRKKGFSRLKYVLKTFMVTVLGKLLFHFKVKTATIDWGAYKPDFVSNADFYKFDGTLKMILDSTDEKTSILESWLEKLYQEGKLFYGLQRSEAAILTCLVFSYAGHHAHFVDGAGGGYALAALELKKRRHNYQMRRLEKSA